MLGQSALMVLRALLFHFLDAENGQLDPSYQADQESDRLLRADDCRRAEEA